MTAPEPYPGDDVDAQDDGAPLPPGDDGTDTYEPSGLDEFAPKPVEP